MRIPHAIFGLKQLDNEFNLADATGSQLRVVACLSACRNHLVRFRFHFAHVRQRSRVECRLDNKRSRHFQESLPQRLAAGAFDRKLHLHGTFAEQPKADRARARVRELDDQVRRSAGAAVFVVLQAAISLSTSTAATQNFDSIGTTVTATLPADFKATGNGRRATGDRGIGQSPVAGRGPGVEQRASRRYPAPP